MLTGLQLAPAATSQKKRCSSYITDAFRYRHPHAELSDVASAFNQPCVSLHRLSMWTGRRCCREKRPRPSSRPSAARRTSVTLTRSSPLKCPRSLLRGSPACSPAKTRKASGTLTTSRTSAEGPRGSSIVVNVPSGFHCDVCTQGEGHGFH